MVVSVFHGRRAEMNHRIVSGKLFGDSAVHGGPEFLPRSWPVGKAIKGSTIAKHNRGIVTVRRGLQFALNVENRPLRGTFTGPIIFPREATAKDDARSLGQDFDVLTERLANELPTSRSCRRRDRPSARHAVVHGPRRTRTPPCVLLVSDAVGPPSASTPHFSINASAPNAASLICACRKTSQCCLRYV